MLAQAPHDPRFTASEFERLARAYSFGQGRLELREGRVVKLSPQHYPHAFTKDELLFALKAALQASDTGFRVTSEVSVALGERFQPMPDLVVWNPANVESPLRGPIPGPAARIIVEVADTSLVDDLGDKLTSYARVGIAEYWVADVDRGRILMHAEPDGDTYARREPRAFGERFEALTLPLLIDTASLAPAS